MATRPPRRLSSKRSSAPSRAPRGRLRILLARTKRPWLRRTLLVCGGLFLISLTVVGVLWVNYARLIDARLGGDQRPVLEYPFNNVLMPVKRRGIAEDILHRWTLKPETK